MYTGPSSFGSSIRMPFEKRAFLEGIINTHEAKVAGRNYSPNILFECADLETASSLKDNDDKEEAIYYFIGGSREFLGSVSSDLSAPSSIILEDIEVILKNSKASTKALNLFAVAKNIESIKIHVLNSDGEVVKPRFVYTLSNVKIAGIYDIGDGNYTYLQLKTTSLNKEHTPRDQTSAEQGKVGALIDIKQGSDEEAS